MEDGYEVMGPGGGGAAAAPKIPPPPCPAVKASKDEKTVESSMGTVSEGKKKKKKGKGKGKKNDDDVGDGTAVNQRPNTCDTILLALTCVVLIIVIAASIPIALTAFGSLDIESIKKMLEGKP